jgi:hypothetical protein
MGSVRRRVVTIGEAVTPRGRVRRLRWRVSFDHLVTLALAAAALGSSAAYQVLVLRRPGRRRSPSD